MRAATICGETPALGQWGNRLSAMVMVAGRSHARRTPRQRHAQSAMLDTAGRRCEEECHGKRVWAAA